MEASVEKDAEEGESPIVNVKNSLYNNSSLLLKFTIHIFTITSTNKYIAHQTVYVAACDVTSPASIGLNRQMGTRVFVWKTTGQ